MAAVEGLQVQPQRLSPCAMQPTLRCGLRALHAVNTHLANLRHGPFGLPKLIQRLLRSPSRVFKGEVLQTE